MFYKYRWYFLLLYLVFGFYMINYPFQFVKIPAVVLTFDKWIFFVAGLLIVLGGISYFKVTRYVPMHPKRSF